MPVTETMSLINNIGLVTNSPIHQMLPVIHGSHKEQVCEVWNAFYIRGSNYFSVVREYFV